MGAIHSVSYFELFELLNLQRMTFGRNCTAQYLIPYHLSAVQLGSGFICPQYREFLEFPASGYNIWADVRGTSKFPHGNKDWKPSRFGGFVSPTTHSVIPKLP
jgi:hypothetical protein